MFQGCGSPQRVPNGQGARYRRSDDFTPYEDYAFGENFLSSKRKQERPATAAGTNLDKLVRDIKEKVRY